MKNIIKKIFAFFIVLQNVIVKKFKQIFSKQNKETVDSEITLKNFIEQNIVEIYEGISLSKALIIKNNLIQDIPLNSTDIAEKIYTIDFDIVVTYSKKDTKAITNTVASNINDVSTSTGIRINVISSEEQSNGITNRIKFSIPYRPDQIKAKEL